MDNIYYLIRVFIALVVTVGIALFIGCAAYGIFYAISLLFR